MILPPGQTTPTALGQYPGIDIGLVEFFLLGFALLFGLLVITAMHAHSFKLSMERYLNAKSSAIFSLIQCIQIVNQSNINAGLRMLFSLKVYPQCKYL